MFIYSFLSKSGANPNAQTTCTEKMEERENERSHARDLAKIQARTKALDIIKQNQKNAKDKRKEDELMLGQQLGDSQEDIHNAVADSIKRANPFQEDLGISHNPFEEDLGLSSNPFDQDSGQCINSDDSNPFMEDIRAETYTSLEHSYKETTKLKSRATNFEEEFYNPTEEEIKKVMKDQNLYKDPFANTIIADCYGKTPLHEAVIYRHEDVLNCFINFQDSNCRGGRLHLLPDYNLIDSEEQTCLEVALWTKQYKMASRLLEAGANINLHLPSGLTIIHKAIMKQDVETSLYLLNHEVDSSLRTNNNTSVLQLAIQYCLQPVVEALCSKNIDLDACDDSGNCPLWTALASGQINIATTLISHGCSPDAWSIGPNGCTHSLLHRAICDKYVETACFLIRNNCDINSPRRPGPEGDGGIEAWDGLSPLHLACTSSLDIVVQCLVEHKCNVNSKDSEGRAPIHIAISSKHPIITSLLLAHPDIDVASKDRKGNSPFALAMSVKNHEAASAILSREPDAAEQFDAKGLNFLHEAVLNIDVETILFLVGVGADVNSQVQDSSHQTALHLAVTSGNEMIVRHLLLAGAQLNDCDKHGQTSLHIAAIKNHPSIISALLREGVDLDAVDERGNNALHVSVQHGHLECVRVLLTESSINAELKNTRGQNPLHILCQYSNENALAILELFCQTMPEYPINASDVDGNTPLFLAYINGAARLCREILRNGGLLATVNKYGISIFNAEVPTKKLLFSLLDMLDAEPPWSDGSNCHECSVRFTVKTRKHHCRHCGRLLCGKCSDKQIPIVKYELTKPVRVCSICFDMLTSGVR
ncbi:Rabankyrin-5 [Exaiptasia diaphana]|nr:Rabankyrin-5 [Exaiptasia diaphana]